ncbi:UrcA family protein [Erythrobacter sanguineus]|nr:UrcA family protein [Erythrobacter sanguineus]
MSASDIILCDILSIPGVSTMRFTLPLIALSAVAAITAPAIAAPQAAEQTVLVRIAYGDIDLTSAEGRAALEARIDAKLRQVCTVQGIGRFSNGRAVRDESCITEARTAALAEVERVAAYEARRGRAIAAN